MIYGSDYNFSHTCSPLFARYSFAVEAICMQICKTLVNCSRFAKFAKVSPAIILRYTVYL